MKCQIGDSTGKTEIHVMIIEEGRDDIPGIIVNHTAPCTIIQIRVQTDHINDGVHGKVNRHPHPISKGRDLHPQADICRPIRTTQVHITTVTHLHGARGSVSMNQRHQIRPTVGRQSCKDRRTMRNQIRPTVGRHSYNHHIRVPLSFRLMIEKERSSKL